MKTLPKKLAKFRLLTLFLMIIFIGNNVVSIAGDNKISIGEKVKLKSSILNEEREILVYTPPGYDLSSDTYPVMYVLDGGFHFHHASGIIQFMASQGMIPPTIVVAIVNVDRGRDFSPTQLKDKPKTGGAEKFMGFLNEELIPYIDQNYHTNSHTTIVGHSLGGTFVTYAFLENPDLFDGYIAISPYLMYDDNLLVNKTSEMLKPNYKDHKFMYVTLGDEPDYYEAVGNFVKTIKSANPEGLEFYYTQMPEENHGSIPHRSIYNGLEKMYSDWKLPKEAYAEGLAAIDKHYQKVSDKFGYEIETPEYVINLLGYNYLGKNNMDEAIKIFQENVKRYPKSANVYDSLGEAYEKNDQVDQAEKNYAKAVDIASKQNHNYLKVYEENLKRVQQVIAER
jgi:predicted alpha/beta superfamily hydrolase